MRSSDAKTINIVSNNPFDPTGEFAANNYAFTHEWPSDLPPLCPTELELLGEKACAIILQLELRIREFNEKGQTISETIKDLPVQIYSKFNESDSEQRHSLQSLMQSIIDLFTILYQLNDPFPAITELLNKKLKTTLDFWDITHCLNILNQSIIDPAFNRDFKMRAIQCAKLTLFYERLIKCPINMSDIANLLIIPMQRLSQLNLFANELFKDLISLKSCNTQQGYDIYIDHAITIVFELKCRSKMIAHAVNAIKKTIDMICEYNSRFELDKLPESLIEKMVTDIMESPIETEEIFSTRILEKIEKNYLAPMRAQHIFPCDYLYKDICSLLTHSESNRKVEINALAASLKAIYENTSFDVLDKLVQMQLFIEESHDQLVSTLGSFFGPKKSTLAKELNEFIQTMGSYSAIISDENCLTEFEEQPEYVRNIKRSSF